MKARLHVLFAFCASGLTWDMATAEPLYYTSGSSVFTWNSATGVTSRISTYTDPLGRIVFDPAGNLFAVFGGVAGGTGIARLTTSGSWSVVASDMNQPYYLAGLDRDGSLYASRFSSGVITKVDSTGATSDFATVPEMVSGLVCDDQGTLYATGGKRVFKITASGSVSTFVNLANYGWSSDVSGITRSNSGTLYVARYGNPSFAYSLDQQGTPQLVGGHSSGLPYASQLAVDESNQVFVQHTWSPFAGSSQITCVTTGANIGYSGFSVGGIAAMSVAVPEPGTVALLTLGLFSLGVIGRSRTFLKAKG